MTCARYRLSLLLSAFLVTSACEKWPTNSKWAAENLQKNQDTFKDLEEALVAGDYVSVNHVGTLAAYGTALTEDGMTSERELSDEIDWAEMLTQVGVIDISRNEDAFFYTISDVGWDDTHAIYTYIHHPNVDQTYVNCLPEHRHVPCGECVVALRDNWWLHYKWIPGALIGQNLDDLLDGKISEDEYERWSQVAFEECWREGFHQMGYELDSPLEERADPDVSE